MTQQYKHMKPSNPFTVEVLTNIEAKVGQLLKKFKEFDPSTGLIDLEKREHRESDIRARLVESVMKSYKAFKDNDKCSYASFVNLGLDSAVKHYVRDAVYEIKINRKKVYGDELIYKDDEVTTFFDQTACIHDHLLASLDRMDFEVVYEILKHENPLYAQIFSLTIEGYSLREISEEVKCPKWLVCRFLWPKTKALVKSIYKNLY